MGTSATVTGGSARGARYDGGPLYSEPHQAAPVDPLQNKKREKNHIKIRWCTDSDLCIESRNNTLFQTHHNIISHIPTLIILLFQYTTRYNKLNQTIVT